MRLAVKNEALILMGAGAAALFAAKRPKAAMALAGAAGFLYASKRRGKESFKGKSVLITGGSRGLGLALALEFAREGAKVAVVARDKEELLRAKSRVEALVPTAHLRAYACDVTDHRQFAEAIKLVVLEQGGLDVLVNNAGAITVGPFEAMDNEDFEAQMRLHFLAPVHACRLALPYLRERAGGRIVNICSMGGKVAVPHMLPYDASKFALSGFSQGLMAELAEEGISVTTVYPAVMRTGSPIQAVFKGDHDKEFAWFASADVLPGLSLGAASAARKVVEAARNRTAELVPSVPAKARNILAAAFPETFASLMGMIASYLPKGYSRQHFTGADSRKVFDHAPLLWPLRALARKVEKDWNQEPKHDARFNMGL
jgi:NAD(P)-dependent dehydrogenase (short-subunit alcohol dehydrogenase family)